jgi:hypothetical protein
VLRRRIGRQQLTAAVVVTCECGWTTRGAVEPVVEAMQVHGRQIHGWELTRDQVLAEAEPTVKQDGSGRR